MKYFIRLLHFPQVRNYFVCAFMLVIFFIASITLGEHLSDYISGTVQGFLIALLPVLFVLTYNQAKKIEQADGHLKAIYLELIENLAYFRSMDFESPDIAIHFLPPLPKDAWAAACASGMVDPTNKLHNEIRVVYRGIETLSFYLQKVLELYLRPMAEDQTDGQLKYLNSLNRDVYRYLYPIAREVKGKIEAELCISEDEIAKIQADINDRISSLMKSPIPILDREFFTMELSTEKENTGNKGHKRKEGEIRRKKNE